MPKCVEWGRGEEEDIVAAACFRSRLAKALSFVFAAHAHCLPRTASLRSWFLRVDAGVTDVAKIAALYFIAPTPAEQSA